MVASNSKSRWSEDLRPAERKYEGDGQEQNARIPTHDEIQLRAFNIYMKNGCKEGECESNWLEAERELQEEFRDGTPVASTVAGSGAPL